MYPYRPRPSVHPGRLAVLLLTAVLLLLSACEAHPNNPSPTIPIPSSPAETAPPETASTPPEAEAADSLIAELQAAILALKEENYILRAAYEARIASLEQTIAALQASGDTETTPSAPAVTPLTPEEPANPPAFTFERTEKGVTLLSYVGTRSAVNVPPTVEGLPVTAIADEAFRGCAVTEVTLPDTVTDIGWLAFADCPVLRTITLPASVTSIGYGAFDHSPTVTLRCPPASYAAAWAESFGIPHEPLGK